MNEIAQHLLDIDDKKRSNLFKWNGQFSPQFIEAILESYAKEGDTILDPFSGSGTVLFESAKLNLNVIGFDINPSAIKISNIYKLCNVNLEERKLLIDHFELHMLDIIGTLNDSLEGYPKSVIDNILFKNEYQRILFEGFVILSGQNKYINNKAKVYSLLRDFVKVIGSLPFSTKSIECHHADCRRLPLNNNSVDLVITSPPYINVFNYHQQYRKNAEALGYDILKIAKSEIGSNRKFRSNRFLTVLQYAYDISKCLEEISRVSKDNARIVFIVGKVSRVLNTEINNGDIVKDIALAMGFEVPFIQERSFKNKYGRKIIELIINMQNRKHINIELHDITEIANRNLFKACEESGNETVKKLITEAIIKGENVDFSPIFDLNN